MTPGYGMEVVICETGASKCWISEGSTNDA